MARQNITRDDNNFQKRGVCVAVFDFVEADVLFDSGAGSVGVNLPDNIVILSAGILVETVSSTGSATCDILVGASVLANEVAVTAAGMIPGTVVAAVAEQATGGELIIRNGAVAPAAGDLVGKVIVEYIELDKVTGEYTQMLDS